jgi:biopolymer transport protein ExbB
MKDPGGRADRYGKKVRGLVIPGQKKRFRGAVGGQIEAERFIKTLGVPVLYQNYYMIFAKELLKIKSKHSGQLAEDEACLVTRRWQSRGLNSSILNYILVKYGFYCPDVICEWLYRRKLTFSGNIATSNLDDFPVLVVLDNTNFDFSHAQANGEDIRFIDSATCPYSGTPLKHEIECWDNVTQQARVWVKVPRIDASSVTDFIYMYYGNPAVADGQDPPNVWNAGYVMVQHMNDDPNTSTITGSTSLGVVGNKKGANEPVQAAGKLCYGQFFDGVNDYITCPKFTLPAATIECIFRVSVMAGAKYLLAQDRVGTNCGDFMLSVNQIAANKVVASFDRRICVENNQINIIPADTISAGVWYHVAATMDASATELFVAGVSKGANGRFPYLGNSVAPFDIGGYSSLPTAVPFSGDIDEIRVSNTVRSSDWVMATKRACFNELITYGAEETN